MHTRSTSHVTDTMSGVRSLVDITYHHFGIHAGHTAKTDCTAAIIACGM
ncbi:hypothetical protein BDK61_4705 [Haloarcula quadrata]|uniref:Uncharacterized protein n=1 Tax=Haloarcula quadrata TaxID=182779 RepID=A0A495QQA7_9EURY|nr:hypothetical protein BDK61_4705 [Haloarcula quadrata]